MSTAAYAMRVVQTGPQGFYVAEAYIAVAGLASAAAAQTAATALGLQRAGDATITPGNVAGVNYSSDNVTATNVNGPQGFFRVTAPQPSDGTTSAEIYAQTIYAPVSTQANAIAAVQALMTNLANGSPTINGGHLQGLI